ncbi:DMSO/TMAO reductase YedYZ, molybdopterin-dependent catalytic subunit [Rhizobiales bacterium GAS191]|nr:DMSO/TMAO reductase YedYZ, molybdopterin-dependent catalytic subunit [Rhizobiales bacterium GAS191]
MPSSALKSSTLSRRDMFSLAACAAMTAPLAVGSARAATAAPQAPPLALGLPSGVATEARLEALPGKAPLIKLSYRPPNYESPLAVFQDPITSNDNFFVRYHLADIPQVNAATWRLAVGGDGAAKPFEIGFEELKKDYQPVELVAVCQCSGNRRGLASPHVPGVEWGIGAMGNASWRGARLKDVLAKAGLKDEAIEIAFDGADGPVLDKTPDFVKSLPVWKAIDPDTIIAYEMNGQPLPHFNGFPARIVAPGWTATYWMKHLTSIEARLKPLDNFWMKGAYRVPARLFPSVQRFLSQEAPANTPITEIMVNSLITSHASGATAKADEPVTVAGLAWDAGYGIASVEISTDGGKSWMSAELGQDLGRYSFRGWQAALGRPARGRLDIMAKATNAIGQSQPMTAIPNPAGYHHNTVARLALDMG